MVLSVLYDSCIFQSIFPLSSFEGGYECPIDTKCSVVVTYLACISGGCVLTFIFKTAYHGMSSAYNILPPPWYSALSVDTCVMLKHLKLGTKKTHFRSVLSTICMLV